MLLSCCLPEKVKQVLSALSVSRQEGKPGPADPSQEVFLAFGRVFSGVLHDGQAVHVLSAAYNPAQPHLQRQIHHVSTNIQTPLHMQVMCNSHLTGTSTLVTACT